jgi:hypothetical protein
MPRTTPALNSLLCSLFIKSGAGGRQYSVLRHRLNCIPTRPDRRKATIRRSSSGSSDSHRLKLLFIFYFDPAPTTSHSKNIFCECHHKTTRRLALTVKAHKRTAGLRRRKSTRLLSRDTGGLLMENSKKQLCQLALSSDQIWPRAREAQEVHLTRDVPF